MDDEIRSLPLHLQLADFEVLAAAANIQRSWRVFAAGEKRKVLELALALWECADQAEEFDVLRERPRVASALLELFASLRAVENTFDSKSETMSRAPHARVFAAVIEFLRR
jgi:hypothetical protein